MLANPQATRPHLHHTQNFCFTQKFCFFFIFVYGNAREGGEADCEQSLFFFRFSEGSARELDGPRKERDYA